MNSYILDLRQNRGSDSSFNYFDSLRIAFYISETERVEAETHNKSVFFRKYSFPIFSSSPVSTEPKLAQRIDSIQIFSKEIFHARSKSYQPGESLNDQFLINEMPITNFLRGHKTNALSATNNKCSVCFNKYTITYLSLLDRPTKPIELTLYLKLSYDDGASSEFETPVLKVQAD